MEDQTMGCLETCSWCTEEWKYWLLKETPDGSMVCPDCRSEMRVG